MVGHRAVLAGQPFSTTAQTLEETSVCTIPAALLIAVIRKSSDCALDVLAKVARELRKSEDALVDLPHKTVRQRLAAVLLLLSQGGSGGRPQQPPPVVRLARRDLAHLIAASPESVSRALHRFAAERSVECFRTGIRLLSLPALRRTAGDAPHLDGGQVAD